MPKLKLIAEYVYDADPDDYGTDDPVKMAEIDESNFRDEPGDILWLLPGPEIEVVVEEFD
jgi:hypothetical protein